MTTTMNTKKQNVHSDVAHNYNVELRPLHFQRDDQFVQTNALATVRSDSWDVLGTVSKRYHIIQNNELDANVRQSFERSGVEIDKMHSYCLKNGRDVQMVYEVRNRVKDVKRGDAVGLRFIATNSFDGKSSATFGIGILRLVCTNGMVGLNNFQSFIQKHSQQPDYGRLDNLIVQGIDQFEKLTDQLTTLTTKPLTIRRRAEAARNLALHGVYCQGVYNRIIDRIHQRQEIDGGDNAWGLLNSITHVHSHELSLHRHLSGQESVRKATKRLLFSPSIYEDSDTQMNSDGIRFDRERIAALGEHEVFQLN